ncbi:MAG: adenosine-specific kinase [Candidatus Bathyarchaeia archaeon]
MSVRIEVIGIEVPEGCSIIIGITHFIKSVEDIYEAVKSSTPDVEFAVGFCEASGPCLVRVEGNSEDLKRKVGEQALKLGVGHSFIVYLRKAYPINVLNELKRVPEVCSILCATANPVQAVVAETEQGRAILGVVDGFKSKGIETDQDRESRKAFLRRIGYKL